MAMYKISALMLLLLVSTPGCLHRKGSSSKKEVASRVDIPIAGDSVKSYFDDENIGEFVLPDGQAMEIVDAVNDYSWIDDSASNQSFKTVYFAFDKYAIQDSQKEVVAYDADVAKSMTSKPSKSSAPKIIAEGHCDLHGSPAYNFALSEKRARSVANQMIEQGVDPESIQIVGRGQEMPVIVNGKVCTGTPDQQWLNRRVELRVISA